MTTQPDKALLPIGTRIRFIKELSCGPCEDHPAFLYAPNNGFGEITGHNTREGYWVRWDGWPEPFGAGDEEFEPLSAAAALAEGGE